MAPEMAGARFWTWLVQAKLYNQPPIIWGDGVWLAFRWRSRSPTLAFLVLVEWGLGLVNSRPARVSYAVGTHLSFRTQHA